ncbi:Transmembrane osmosensor [Physocladia obscura]|uniref:Transmembrane osmosensor n=1 Tax=Physocladia obscura TaxID=109957 RepID=A0AAD5SS74_9FUNG|nr:Transmembrane osmosensor [Physocladia obscura]
MHVLNESQIVAFVAIGFDFLVGISDNAVTGAKGNYKSGAFGCIAAGAIFQAVVFLYWIVAFGSTPTSLVGNALADAGGGDGAALSFSLPSVSLPKVSFPQRQQTQPPIYDKSAPPAPANSLNSPYAVPAGLAGTPPPPVPQANAEPAVVVVGQARALYAYAANAADPNEISFSKGQILEILDNKGKWWHARYQDPKLSFTMSLWGLLDNFMQRYRAYPPAMRQPLLTITAKYVSFGENPPKKLSADHINDINLWRRRAMHARLSNNYAVWSEKYANFIKGIVVEDSLRIISTAIPAERYKTWSIPETSFTLQIRVPTTTTSNDASGLAMLSNAAALTEEEENL